VGHAASQKIVELPEGSAPRIPFYNAAQPRRTVTKVLVRKITCRLGRAQSVSRARVLPQFRVQIAIDISVTQC